ncbi:alginate O-acetyltransferase AlgF [Deinococcus misasensis]|uniref:alginate O-acetyltransferase AlgF n=1 Tax=Deinococcus misasensis TaxID=392413 RepID=UPI0005556A63|nr:alginate O-acetyltransferase AlgF [Deinococcus misasensis]
MKKLLWLVLSLSISQVHAQEALYDPAPPANSAYVRAFNLDASSTELTVEKKNYGKLNTLSASAYLIIPDGKQNVLVNKASQSLSFSAGKYYTLLLQGGKVQVMEDESNTNRAKALITLYNLTDSKNVGLKTADGKATVFKDVEIGKSKSQAVNGIKVALSVVNGSDILQAFKETQLERGAAYSVFVTGSKGTYKAVWVQSTTSTK